MRRERVAHRRRAPGSGRPPEPAPARGARSPGTRAETPWARAGTVLVLLGALAVSAAPQIRAQELRYRGEHLFAVPAETSEAMLAQAAPPAWRHFPEHTRYLDVDGDGEHDFIAIALGAQGGYGAQIRYRLRYETGSTEARLGDWYWSVITGPGGERLFESFNP